MLIPERSKIMGKYVEDHREQVSSKILKTTIVYLLLSTLWNTVFLLLHLPYSRANLLFLLACIFVWGCIMGAKRYFRLSSKVTEHLVLLFMIFLVISLYFGSGYREAWSFFLLIPLISGFYGDRMVLVIYSVLGLSAMIFFGERYPHIPNVYDSIDISNRILLYIIVATFSHLLLNQLNRQYEKQVNTITESAEATIDQVVKTFIVAVEAKDYYTFGHSERVSKYAVELARILPEFRDPKRLQALRMSGLLHDIGKMNIPEHILVKTGPLTEEEYELIKTHPIVGGRMVEKISLLGSLKPGVLYHHEKWDGSGYPAGIKGNEIPLEARILAIADVFDAVTSNRAYREALTVEQAFDLLERGRATHFDPYLIDQLPKVKSKWIEIYREMNDEFGELETLSGLL